MCVAKTVECVEVCVEQGGVEVVEECETRVEEYMVQNLLRVTDWNTPMVDFVIR